MNALDSTRLRRLKTELKALKLKYELHPDYALLSQITVLEGIIVSEQEDLAWQMVHKIIGKITGRNID